MERETKVYDVTASGDESVKWSKTEQKRHVTKASVGKCGATVGQLEFKTDGVFVKKLLVGGRSPKATKVVITWEVGCVPTLELHEFLV